MSDQREKAIAGFRRVFDRDPTCVVRAPGRVNLIGDHTDYSGGLALPLAIDRAAWIAAAPHRGDLEIYSERRRSLASHDLAGTLSLPVAPPWAAYSLGTAMMLRHSGAHISAASLYIGGDLPDGAGLASSAALTVGVAGALLHLAEARIDPRRLAELCRKVEHQFANAPCGLMDPLVCLLAKEGHALLIDFDSLLTQQVRIDETELRFFVIDSGVKHSIGAMAYRDRTEDVNRALAALRQRNPRLTSLRAVTERDLEAWRASSSDKDEDEVLIRRARHVVTENHRVREAVAALESRDYARLGKLLWQSHESLRDDFESSCDEADQIVEACRAIDGVYGARITGGGFGGYVVCAVAADKADQARQCMAQELPEATSDTKPIFEVRSSGCVEVFNLA